MSHADVWLDGILRAGGDTEPPPLPNIPTDYLPKPREKHPSSSPPGSDTPLFSPAKRKRSVLVEIKLPNKNLPKPREASAVFNPPKRQSPVFTEDETQNMAPRSRSYSEKTTTSERNMDEDISAVQDAVDINKTPKQTRRNNRIAIQDLEEGPIPLRPTPASSGQSETSVGIADSWDQQDASVNESTNSKNTKRSCSPTKKMVQLRAVKKKVVTKSVTHPSDIPNDVQHLREEIQDISASGDLIIPMKIKDQVEKVCKGVEKIGSSMFAPQVADMDPEQLAKELNELVKIRDGTSFCNDKNVNEPTWNERVHGRILLQAVEHLPGVDYHNITTARVFRELVPDNIYGEELKKKMVNYAITLSDPVITEDNVLSRLRSSTGKLRRSINPSDYSPLCYDPVAAAIETKTPDGSAEDALVQLGIWVTAQFNRLHDLLPLAIAEDPVSITLPLLRVSGESWTLYFAREQKFKIEIIGSVLIGSTASIIGCYKILTAIRSLCKWAKTTFKNWFEKNILTPE